MLIFLHTFSGLYAHWIPANGFSYYIHMKISPFKLTRWYFNIIHLIESVISLAWYDFFTSLNIIFIINRFQCKLSKYQFQGNNQRFRLQTATKHKFIHVILIKASIWVDACECFENHKWPLTWITQTRRINEVFSINYHNWVMCVVNEMLPLLFSCV